MSRLVPAGVLIAALIGLLFVALAGQSAHAVVLGHHRFAKLRYRQTTLTQSAKPRTGGITYLMSNLRAIQRAVDHGDRQYLYHLDPVQVTLRDLPHYGFTRARITLVHPARPRPAPTAHSGEDGLPETDVIVRYRGREYWIVLNQFVKHGPKGIWSIITITPM